MPYADPEKKREYNRQYFIRNQEQSAAQAKAWRENNRERYNFCQKQWKENNSEKVKDSDRRKRVKASVARSAYNRKWVKENREKLSKRLKEWRKNSRAHKANMEKRREGDNAKRLEKYHRHRDFYQEYYRMYGHRAPRRSIIFVKLDLCNGICYICGNILDKKDVHADHVVPMFWGGTNDIWNLMPTHSDCNKRKANILGYPAIRWELVGICSNLRSSPRMPKRSK